ncbi:rhamnogalacturonan lyase family protein [Massilia varians]
MQDINYTRHVRTRRQQLGILLPVAALLSACGAGTVPETGTMTRSSANAARQLSTVVSSAAVDARLMENLGRGVVAVRTSANAVFVSWRLLGLDPDGVAFNVYRSTNGGPAIKLNATPLTQGTNYVDGAAATAFSYSYSVRPVIAGVEQPASAAFALKANGPVEPIVRIPLANGPEAGYASKFVWVGDLDGDGEYDYVLDRLAPYVEGSNEDLGVGQQFLEAFKRDGTRLWRIGMGPGSLNTYNVKPGPATLSVGMYDGVTVYDLNGDGKAEVILKIANGVTFGNGTTFTNADPNKQFVAVIDGQTGVPLATHPFPSDFYTQAGPFGTQLGIGYADGVNPSIYYWGRNRNTDKGGTFNNVFASWTWNGGSTITQNWVFPFTEVGNPHRPSHQMRIIDIDGDGKDEVATGNFMINSNGSQRYVLDGVSHGDRFHITRFGPTQTALKGYGVQQHNPSGLLEYFYDASTGVVEWGHSTAGELVDVGRGQVGDIDPRVSGLEVWSFYGVFNGLTNTLTEPNTNLRPWPSHTIWWDGDLLAESLNDHKLEKWNHLAPTVSTGLKRLVSVNSSAYGTPKLANKNPYFFGDIMGDWRSEIVLMNQAENELVIFTTNVPTSTRLYTMAHNPAYRNGMTIKGYMQAHLPDYYIGADMEAPPQPNIRYVGTGTFQAESARLAGGTTVNTDRSGYRGTGFLSFPATGGSAELSNIHGGAGESKLLTVRYANGNPTPRTGILKINGVARSIIFKPTGSFSAWATIQVPVVLQPGFANVVRFESTGQSLGIIDEITVQ